MKIKSVVIALILFAVSAFSQGTINFQNGSLQRLFINDGAGTRAQMPAGGNAFTFYVTYGSSAGSMTFNSLANPIFNSSSSTGLLAGNTGFVLANAPGGTPIFLQIFGYSTAAGSYANAASTAGFYAGSSAIIEVTPSSTATGTAIFGNVTTPNLVGPFDLMLTPVPEPSTIALGALGIGSLFLIRRRK